MTKIKIDKEFSTLLRKLDDEEYKLLKESILEEGCRDPLVAWEEKNILLDGHNRKIICDENELEYDITYLELDCRENAYDWIINNQLGKRNATQEYKSYLRGKRYNAEKKRKEDYLKQGNISPSPHSMETGGKYQDFVVRLFKHEYNRSLHMMTSQKGQFNIGENDEGVEIKLDSQHRKYGHLSIEIAEKTKNDLSKKYIPSGICTHQTNKNDNTKWYLQGDYHTLYIFDKKQLYIFYHTNNLDTQEKFGTLKTFYLEKEDYEKAGLICTININEEQRKKYKIK